MLSYFLLPTFLSVLSEANVNGEVQDTDKKKYPHPDPDYIGLRLTSLSPAVTILFNTAGIAEVPTKTESADLYQIKFLKMTF